jgi:hypothetical protein
LEALRVWHDLCTSFCDLKHPSSIAVIFHAHVARKKELVSHLWDTATFILGQDLEDKVETDGMKAVVDKYLNKWRVAGERGTGPVQERNTGLLVEFYYLAMT